jgi:transcriptional regulator with XRE-family HTH domain
MTKRRPSIADEWKAFRKSRLFTQSELARVLSMSRRQVHNIEHGVSIPTYRTQARFNALKAKHYQEE